MFLSNMGNKNIYKNEKMKMEKLSNLPIHCTVIEQKFFFSFNSQLLVIKQKKPENL